MSKRSRKKHKRRKWLKEWAIRIGWAGGMVTVKDPNSRINSEKNWDFQEIKYQIRNLWAISI